MSGMKSPSLHQIQVDALCSGERNMRIDNMMFDSFMQGEFGAGAAVRLYGWEEPTISLGRFQSAEPFLTSGIEAVTRPTGGRAVMHTPEEVTYLVLGGARAGFPSDLLRSYRLVSEILIGALARLGVEACCAGRSQYQHRTDCFGTSTSSDLLVEGKKICGGAQRRVGTDFLQHGTILVTKSQCMAQGLVSSKESLSGIISIEEVVGTVSREDVTGSIYTEMNEQWSPCRL